MTTTTVGPVTIDGTGVAVLAEYDPAHRWNGWLAAPLLDAVSVERVMSAVTFPADLNPRNLRHDWDGDVLVVAEGEGAETFVDRIAPNKSGFYALGAFGWVWSEAHPLDYVASVFGVVIDPNGFVFVHNRDGRVVVVDEVEAGVLRVGLYPSEADEADELVETDEVGRVVDVVRGWGF